MKLRQLEAFRAVMLYGTVTLASEMLHISQPATTRLIADLERSLRFKLFDRVKGRLMPTVEATALFEEVQRSLAGVDRIARAADEIRNLTGGSLLIAAAPAIALTFLPYAITAYLKNRPEANISLSVHSSRTVLDMVMGQRCDVGLAILPMRYTTSHGEPLLTARMVCALPGGHPLCTKDLITPRDIGNERLVLQSRNVESRMQIDAVFASHGVQMNSQIDTQLGHAVCSYVEAGAGLGIVDAFSAWSFRNRGLVFKPFEPQLTTEFAVLTPAQRAAPILLKSFITHVQEMAQAELGQDLISA